MSSFKPPNRDEIKGEYDKKYPLYKNLIKEVKYILSKNIALKKIEISDIESRV
jgi:hypothetical protein